MSCGTAAQRVSKVIIIIIINIYTSLFYPRDVWQTILFFSFSSPPNTANSKVAASTARSSLLTTTTTTPTTTVLFRWRLQWVFDERRAGVQCMYREIFASNLMTTAAAAADSSAPPPTHHAAISTLREPKDYLKIPSEGVRPPGHRIFCFFFRTDRN